MHLPLCGPYRSTELKAIAFSATVITVGELVQHADQLATVDVAVTASAAQVVFTLILGGGLARAVAALLHTRDRRKLGQATDDIRDRMTVAVLKELEAARWQADRVAERQRTPATLERPVVVEHARLVVVCSRCSLQLRVPYVPAGPLSGFVCGACGVRDVMRQIASDGITLGTASGGLCSCLFDTVDGQRVRRLCGKCQADRAAGDGLAPPDGWPPSFLV